MRLEISIEHEKNRIYPLNKLKNSVLTIGSHHDCDIQLSVEGVSRRHIQIITQGEEFFALDLGSTNGSYINEERLMPGQKVPFTSFFPIRLGAFVLLTLLSDED
jgi:pSer/pThr/pTyr-binding forkhead associated (FHA) protein